MSASFRVMFPTEMRIEEKMRSMPSFPLAKGPLPRRYFQRQKMVDDKAQK